MEYYRVLPMYDKAIIANKATNINHPKEKCFTMLICS